MAEFRIYQGEIGLRSENAQLKAELARLRADNARLRGLVGEEIEAAAPLASDAFARQTSSNAKIGSFAQVAPAQPRVAVVSVMGQAPHGQAGQISGEGTEGAKFTIGAAPGNLPQLNPAIAAARAARPGVVAPTPVEPEIAAMVKKAEAEIDEDESERRFSQMELR